MMGLDPSPLVRTLLHFALVNPLLVLDNPLVMFVAWALALFLQLESSQLATLFHWSCFYQDESSPKVVDS